MTSNPGGAGGAGLEVWRIVAARYRDRAYDGEGARLHGGRWNHPGTPAVYASSHLSLAALELFVHLDPDTLPEDLAAVPALFPADLRVDEVPVSDLPAGWRGYPAPEAIQDLGDEWLRSGTAAALRVPSAVLPREHNLLLNPGHSDFRRIRVGEAEPFHFDPRMVSKKVYQSAREQFFSIRPRPLRKAGRPLPSRHRLHERAGVD